MIPIYIGISERFRFLEGMTSQSILDNTNADVEIIHLYPEIESGCTGFSDVRYTIKKGIYLDVDMVVLGDIKELWDYRKESYFVCLKDGQTEVSVIDCNHSCRNKNEQHKLPKKNDIPMEWNVTDAWRESGKVIYRQGVPENTKLFHFTALQSQPWFHDHPNKEAVKLYEHYKPRT